MHPPQLKLCNLDGLFRSPQPHTDSFFMFWAQKLIYKLATYILIVIFLKILSKQAFMGFAMVAMPWLFLSITCIISTALPLPLQGTEETFFSDHFVRKVENNLIHVHKVCLQGGRDGLIVPCVEEAEHVLSTFSGLLSNASRPLSLRQFSRNKTSDPFNEHDSMRSKKVWGPTYFMNCWRVDSYSTSPSHWLMKVNKMFYAAERQLDMRASNNDALALLPKFQNLAIHQCPSLKNMLSEKSAWPWGRHLFLAASAHWTEADLWKSLSAINIVELPMSEHNLTCFEDIYLDTTYGEWSPGQKYQRRWQNALKSEIALAGSSNYSSLLLEASYKKSNRRSERKSRSMSLRASKHASMRDRNKNRIGEHDHVKRVYTGIKHRCVKGSVRIVVFQRTDGTAMRRFRNLAEVLYMLSNQTSHPVQVVTLTSRSSVQDQARLFADKFDMLVTPHGSHLANIIYSDPHKTAMVEVVPSVIDPVFERNAKQTYFRSYITSFGHRALCDACDTPAVKKCLLEASTDRPNWPPCKDHHAHLVLKQSDLDVDINILSRDVGMGLKALCNMTL